MGVYVEMWTNGVGASLNNFAPRFVLQFCWVCFVTEEFSGRDWLWSPNTKDTGYLNIVKKFEDSRKAPFSIHQIASMGVSEGKEVGQWFGPNTVAQVLKWVFF